MDALNSIEVLINKYGIDKYAKDYYGMTPYDAVYTLKEGSDIEMPRHIQDAIDNFLYVLD
jgi:hypothetical protein